MGASSSSTASGAAKRYSAALFDLALDSGNVDGIDASLTALASAVSSNDALAKALASPIVTLQEKSNVLMDLAKRLDMPDLATRFVGVVAQNGRSGEIGAVAKAFAERAAKHRGSLQVVARTAKKLTAEQAENLTSTVSTALGRDVDVELEVDPALLGGLQLRVGSRLIDASVRTQLDDLTNAMKGA